MSIVYQRQRKKKRKYPRNRVSRKVLHTQKIKRKIFKSRGWKLDYPQYFTVADKYPYIIKKNHKKEV